MTWGVANYSATPASNAAINGINIAENCNASGINDAIRQMMADIAVFSGSVAPLNYLSGLTLSTAGSSATFSVAAGAAADTTNTGLMSLAASISKTTSAWAVGSGNGALDTGAIAINTWYHVWEIKRPDTGVVDVLISLSASAPTMPTNYTLKRRIGLMKTNGSAQWVKFTQLGDDFLWDVPVQDAISVTPGSTAATLVTLSVPTGVQVIADYTLRASAGATVDYGLLTSPDQADTAPSASLFHYIAYSAAQNDFLNLRTRTNTSAQIRHRAINSGAGTSTTSYTITTNGWTDLRGRFG